MPDLSYTMMSMQSMLHRRLMKGLEDTGLSAGQPKVLAYLKSHEGRCQKEIASACLIEPGSLTVLLNRMEKQGLVERRREGQNRRNCFIYLTERGRELAAEVVDTFYEVENQALTGLSEEEQAAFAKLCDRIIENLKTEESIENG